MPKRRVIDPQMIDKLAQNMFHALPLLKKRLLHMDLVQSEHGIPLSHVQVLAMLQDAGTMSVSEISRRLGIAKPNITPLVDRLLESGLVDRQRDQHDRRVVNIGKAGCHPPDDRRSGAAPGREPVRIRVQGALRRAGVDHPHPLRNLILSLICIRARPPHDGRAFLFCFFGYFEL